MSCLNTVESPEINERKNKSKVLRDINNYANLSDNELSYKKSFGKENISDSCDIN